MEIMNLSLESQEDLHNFIGTPTKRDDSIPYPCKLSTKADLASWALDACTAVDVQKMRCKKRCIEFSEEGNNCLKEIKRWDPLDVYNDIIRPVFMQADVRKSFYARCAHGEDVVTKSIDTGFPGATHNFWMIDAISYLYDSMSTPSMMREVFPTLYTDAQTVTVPTIQNLGVVWSQEIFRRADPLFPADRTKDTVFGPSPGDTSTGPVGTQISNTGLEGVVNVSSWLLQDNAFDILRYVRIGMSLAVNAGQTYALINASGVGQPLGLINYPSSQITKIDSATTGSISSDDIATFMAAVPSYESVLIMHPSILAALRSMKTTAGAHIFPDTASKDTIFGHRVYQNEYMPSTVATNNNIMIIAHPAAALNTQGAISLTVDPYTSYPTNKIRYYNHNGFSVIEPDNIKILRVK